MHIYHAMCMYMYMHVLHYTAKIVVNRRPGNSHISNSEMSENPNNGRNFMFCNNTTMNIHIDSPNGSKLPIFINSPIP